MRQDHDDLRNKADDLYPVKTTAIPSQAEQHKRYLPTDSAGRKKMPLVSGFLDYFPDACAAVSEISYYGNEKHNPGEALHHSRGKSMDHADCIARHLTERGTFYTEIINGLPVHLRHTASLAWRAMALLQEELERENDLTLPRGAKIDSGKPKTDLEKLTERALGARPLK